MNGIILYKTHHCPPFVCPSKRSCFLDSNPGLVSPEESPLVRPVTGGIPGCMPHCHRTETDHTGMANSTEMVEAWERQTDDFFS